MSDKKKTDSLPTGIPAEKAEPWPPTEQVVFMPPPEMALRDYFAAATLSLSLGVHGHAANKSIADQNNEAIARWAYQIADAMIAERTKNA